MISLHYISHTKAYNTIYTACNIVEAIYSFTIFLRKARVKRNAFLCSCAELYKKTTVGATCENPLKCLLA